MRVRISRCVVDLIQQAAAAAMPEEACGLLFGDGGAIEAASIEANVADNPLTHFEIDPAALFAAIRAERAGGRYVTGYWHSHPSGDAQPSATDAAMAQADGKIWLIVAGSEVMAWRTQEEGVNGRFQEVELELG